jgi:transcription-repair coupling factor (superfamily II helicase)
MYDLPEKGFLYVRGRIGSFLSFVLAQARGRKRVVLYDNEDEALLLKEELEFFSGTEAHYFPQYNYRIFEREDEAKRTRFLCRLAEDADFTGIFPLNAFGHPLLPPATFKAETRELHFGDVVYQEELLAYLESAGYELASLVREQGEFAKRGAIIDIFPPSTEQPVRVEFLGDEIYSLRYFDPITQRSRAEIESFVLMPASFGAGSGATILDYLGGGAILVHKGLESVLRELKDGAAEDAPKQRFLQFLNVDASGIVGEDAGEVLEALSNEDLKPVFEERKTEVFTTLTEKLKHDWAACRRVYLSAVNRHQAERLQEIFRNYDISLPLLPRIATDGKEKEWGIIAGPLRRGFRTSDMVVLTEEDIVGPKKRVVKKKWEGVDEFLNSFKDLTVGDYVVHLDHGIGAYRGIKKLAVAGVEKDFLLIEYMGEDKLYVPIESLQLVQKYIGGDAAKPKIDRLGSQQWRSTKKRVKSYVEDIAKELLQFYAERELAQGHAFPGDDEIFREMEERFEYEETEGQLRAIQEVMDDLMKDKPMDRVVVGDVGFGKTEVAVRAAFKAIMDNSQVAILVPTSVLAQQHYMTFSERFRDYPVTVEMLSRFRTKDEQAAVTERLKKGSVDVVIGTHRLLQQDIAFRDLGLLIVDEEHRFGVKAKEKLKFLKKNVDVMTLSATPIPRTLHMALTGIKDLSIIDTPPLDRLAVKTYVVKFNDETVRRGISEELARGGQVFFVHNVIHNIGVVHDHLKRLVPDARIAVAHGKMSGSQLEKIMLTFIGGGYDVLLCTNIIESGLDITNVNTVFINNAHRFGLADLYQLRGRVGRGTRQAYAYLLIPSEEVMTRDALLRLKIMEEMTELGSGLRVANYDMEIRGTGNLLGKEQSGRIDLVGFELYCNMLEDAVHALKEDYTEEEKVTAEISIPVNAYIPDTYINDETMKLLTYKRLSKMRTVEELNDIREELGDRYGEIPAALENLLHIIELRLFLQSIHVRRIEHTGNQVIVHVTEQTPLNMARLLKLAGDGKGKVKLLADGRIVLPADGTSEDVLAATRNMLLGLVTV